MTEKAPLITQPTKAPTRKLVAGVTAGTAFAVTLVPVIFPELMKIVEAINPAFAADWGPVIAAVTSAILTVLGGGSVSYVVRNRG
jgi:hypothetical protein